MKKSTTTVRIETDTFRAANLIATAALGRKPESAAETFAVIVSAQTEDRLDLLAERINAELRACTVATALHIGGLLGCEYGFDMRGGWALRMPDGDTFPLGHADVAGVTTLLARRGVELGEIDAPDDEEQA